MTGIAVAACSWGVAAADALAPSALAKRKLDPAVIRRIDALDCDQVSVVDVRDTLLLGPVPRLILIQGSVPIVTMEPFARFLIAMGYPEARIRNPRDGSLSYNSFVDSDVLAGLVASYYEVDGTMPMLIGHSQGGMLVIRTLYELTGRFAQAIAVRDPLSGEALARTSIRDPLTGKDRPVVGLTVGYAAALATGKLARFLLGQWTMLALLRKIPDSVQEFVGFRIPGDLIAGDFGEDPYAATGSAKVVNITLPEWYSHILLPDAAPLASDAESRRFVETYAADSAIPAALMRPGAPANLVHAATIWYGVRKHWCLEAQALVRATAG